MAANITVTGAAEATDGKTWTATLGGGSGTGYGPATGATGIVLKVSIGGQVSNVHAAAGTISGTTITVVSNVIIPSGATVTFDTEAGNIVDNASNTLQIVSAQATTNNSTQTLSAFDSTNAAFNWFGRLSAAASGRRSFAARGTELVFKVTGSDVAIRMRTGNGTNIYRVFVDGDTTGTQFTIPKNNTDYLMQGFSGLSDGTHWIRIKRNSTQSLEISDLAAVYVKGASVSVAAVSTSEGYGVVCQTAVVTPGRLLDSFYNASSGTSGYQTPGYAGNSTGASTGFTDAAFRMRASGSATSTIKLWAFHGTTKTIALYVNGVYVQELVTTNTNVYEFQAFPSTVDLSTEKLLEFVHVGPQNVGQEFDSIMIVGAGAAIGTTAITPRTILAGFGDSIQHGNFENVTTNASSRQAFMHQLGLLFGYTVANKSISGNCLASGGTGTPGQSRTSDITGIAAAHGSEPAHIVMALGTNDVGIEGSAPTLAFGDAATAALTALVAGTTGKIWVYGIRPRGNRGAATVDAWNGESGGGGNGLKERVTALAHSRVKYIDPRVLKLSGATYGADWTTNFRTDQLHMNANGHARTVEHVAPYVCPGNAYSASGPTDGPVGVASSAITITLVTGGKFYSGKILMAVSGATLSATAAGGTVTGNGTGAVEVTPADGQTSFTCTITPTSTGTKSIAFTNAQGWQDPGNYSYNATSGVTPSLGMSGPSTGTVGVPVGTFTVTLTDATFNGSDTVTLNDGGNGGTFTPSVGAPGVGPLVVTPANGATGFTYTYTAASAGAKTLSLTNGQGWTNPGNLTYTASAAVLGMSGPSSGTVLVASTPFTVTLSGTTFNGSQPVTLNDGGDGGTFTPSVGAPGTGPRVVTPTNGATGFTYTYTPATPGVKTISLTNGQGWTNPGNLSYTANPPGGSPPAYASFGGAVIVVPG